MNFIKDLLFPKKCVGCGALGIFICLACEKNIEWRSQELCFVCRRPSNRGKTHTHCDGSTAIDMYTALWKYNAVMKRVIKCIKYRLVADAYQDVFQIAAQGIGGKIADIKAVFGDFALVPIPLHSKRLRERGFNQAELIAQSIHKISGIPFENVLERARYTGAQAAIHHAAQRKANMADAFRIRPTAHVAGGAFLLIDDVITSGATTAEAARVLKAAGARHVAALALAQG